LKLNFDLKLDLSREARDDDNRKNTVKHCDLNWRVPIKKIEKYIQIQIHLESQIKVFFYFGNGDKYNGFGIVKVIQQKKQRVLMENDGKSLHVLPTIIRYRL
jgi:hypothetical protein